MQLETCFGCFNGDDGKVGSSIPDWRILTVEQVTAATAAGEERDLRRQGIVFDPFEVHIPGRRRQRYRFRNAPSKVMVTALDPFRVGRMVERIGASEDVDDEDTLIPQAASDYALYLASLVKHDTASAGAPAFDPFHVTIRRLRYDHIHDPFRVTVKGGAS